MPSGGITIASPQPTSPPSGLRSSNAIPPPVANQQQQTRSSVPQLPSAGLSSSSSSSIAPTLASSADVVLSGPSATASAAAAPPQPPPSPQVSPSSASASLASPSPRLGTINLDKSTREGYLFVQHSRGNTRKWKKRWCVVSDGTFAAHSNWNYLQKDGKAKFSINLLLAAVKPISEHSYAFQLLSPDQVQTVHASSQQEMEEWMNSIQSAIATRLRVNQQRITQNQPRLGQLSATATGASTAGTPALAQGWEFKSTMHLKGLTERGTTPTDELMADPANHVCADCDKRGPQWVSINTCVVICTDCSSAHRKLGTHISKIRSLGMLTIILLFFF